MPKVGIFGRKSRNCVFFVDFVPIMLSGLCYEDVRKIV